MAINDGLMLDQMVDLVVRTNVPPSHPQLDAILRQIHETKRRTVLGQLFDSTTSSLAQCTLDRYEQIILHKTTFYTYALPIRLGYLLADRKDFDELEEVIRRLGLLFSALVS